MKKWKLVQKTLLVVVLSLSSVAGLFVDLPSVQSGVSSSAYVFREGAHYVFNSSDAGFLMKWASRGRGGISWLTEDSLRAHSNLGEELRADRFAVNFWEVFDLETGQHWANGGGLAEQTIIRNASDFSLVKITTSGEPVKHVMYYGFWADRPYVWVRLERHVEENISVFNSQTCMMLRSDMDHFWYTDYEGNIVNWNYTSGQGHVRMAYPMFSAQDNGTSNRLPFIGCYNPNLDITVGRVYLSATPNIRKDIHLWGIVVAPPSYVETQEDWMGNEVPANHWVEGTVMALEYLMFVKSGSPVSEGNIVDYSEDLYNGFKLWEEVPHTYQALYSKWGPTGVETHLRGYTPYLYYGGGIFVLSAEYGWTSIGIPYCESFSLHLGEMRYPMGNQPMYTQWYFDDGVSNTWVDRANSGATGEEFVKGEGYMEGEVWWDTGRVTAYSRLRVFEDSDKMVVHGSLVLDEQTTIKSSVYQFQFSDLYGHREVDDVVQVSPNEYDVRWIDPVYGWVGILVQVNEGTPQILPDQLNIVLFDFTSPQSMPGGTSYDYNITLWSHEGNATGISDFYTRRPLVTAGHFVNSELGDSSFGFLTCNDGYIILDSRYIGEQLTFQALNYTPGQKTVRVYVNAGPPVKVLVDGEDSPYSWDGQVVEIPILFTNTKTVDMIFTPDETPPEVTILSPENRTYSVTDVPLTFTVDEPTSWVGYTLDGQANITITGNTTLWGLADGSHHVAVYANDTAGNMGASTTVYLTVDTGVPTITILSPENVTYAVFNVDLNFTVDEPASWMGYSLDGQANATILGNTTLSSLSDGSHNVVVYANDTAGNMGASTTAYFTVDTAAPVISIISPENKTYYNFQVVLPIDFIFTVDETTSWEGYSLDGGENVTLTGNTTLSGLSEGSHSLTVYANDTSGNWGVRSVFFEIAVVIDREVFSITSNSTISEVTFLSGDKIIEFVISGPSGTIGYTEVLIGKTLMESADDLRIYLDGAEINYTLTSNNGAWVVYFEYEHSVHNVRIVFSPVESVEIMPLVTVLLAVFTISLVGFFIGKKWRARMILAFRLMV